MIHISSPLFGGVSYGENIMPIYEFKDKETGEVSEKIMSLSQYDDYLKENPNLERYYSPASSPGLISDSKSPLTRAGTEWRNHLDRMKKGSGRGNTIKT